MTYLHALILGLVEGATEFLPVSSTGHLILTSELLRIPDSPLRSSFEIFIQLGAILAVLAVYGKKLLLDRRLLARVAVAFLPTAIIGLAAYKLVKTYLLGSITVVLASLAIGGIIIILFEKFHREKPGAVTDLGAITYRQAALIGLCQSLAIIPGVSRAAATILGGQALGLTRKTVVEFSFLLAVPTMAAATGLDLFKSASSLQASDAGILAAGFVVAFLVALAAIRFLLRYIKTNNFTAFGIYRIILAAVMWLVIKP